MIRIVLFAGAYILASTLPAVASTWPDSIFHGAAPQVLGEVKAHADLVREAELYLTVCASKDPDEVQGCESNQYNFVMDYVYAFYNEHMSQSNVAYLLSGELLEPVEDPKAAEESLASQAGIIPHPIQGCAWRLAILGSGGPEVDDTDNDSAQEDCRKLSSVDQAAAQARANVLIKEISVHLARGDRPVDIFTGN
jgi:hypothetical protein